MNSCSEPQKTRKLLRHRTFAELTEKYLYIGRLLLHFSHSLPQNVHDITLLEPGNLRDLAVGELGCYNLLNVYEKI